MDRLLTHVNWFFRRWQMLPNCDIEWLAHHGFCLITKFESQLIVFNEFVNFGFDYPDSSKKKPKPKTAQNPPVRLQRERAHTRYTYDDYVNLFWVSNVRWQQIGLLCSIPKNTNTEKKSPQSSLIFAFIYLLLTFLLFTL